MPCSESFNLLDRKNTDSIKWAAEGMKIMAEYVDDSSIPLWIADMDFKTVPNVLVSLKDRIDHGCFGYSIAGTQYYDAVMYWYKKHYQWDIKKEWIITTRGIVPGIASLIQIFTNEGDGVIIQEPVYYPFRKVIEANDRVVINNGLIEENGEYSIDFDDLEKKASDPNTKLMILCSPHNPVGRIWTREEIQKIARICLENGVLMCSDEIHSDLILFDNKFVTAGTMEEDLLSNIVVCTAPSKTFNLAAFATSNLIIANDNIRNKVINFMDRLHLDITPTFMGNIVVPAVYSPEGEEWLSELIRLIEDNCKYVKEYLKLHLPNVYVVPHQSTFLVWMDFRNIGLPWKEMERKMEEEAKVVLDPGSKFGAAGQGFMRMNLACHQSTLEVALERIVKTFQ